MDIKNAKYILPNMFTLGSAFGGFYSILVTFKAVDASGLATAAWLIAASMILDGLDGRVARATGTQSEFGVQMDSLADALAFGVAPALLIYRWGLESLGIAGIFIAFAFAACGIMRLARFNVLAAHETGPSSFFVGLPIPLAAATLVSVVLAHTSMTGKMTAAADWSVAAITLLLAGLMVSNFRYRTFKKIKFTPSVLLIVVLGLVALVATGVRFSPGLAFVGVSAAYILVGIAESAIGFGKSRVVHGLRRHSHDEEVEVDGFDLEPEAEMKLETTGEFDILDD
jgi:CDP-diacylglycerol--serine O-phosphatidyltransferase